MRAATTFLFTALLLAGCAGSSEQSDQAAATVAVADFAFTPGESSVPAGAAVSWAYGEEGQSRHTVTFEDETSSGDLAPGDTYTRTFTEPGTYAYVCFYHPTMTGTVTVSG